MKIKVYPSVCTGEIQIPPSKSMAHRAIMCASLAKVLFQILSIMTTFWLPLQVCEHWVHPLRWKKIPL